MNSYQAVKLYTTKEAALPAALPWIGKGLSVVGKGLWGARAKLPAFLRTDQAKLGVRGAVKNLASGYGGLAQGVGGFGARHTARVPWLQKGFRAVQGAGDRMLNEGLRQGHRISTISPPKGLLSPMQWARPDQSFRRTRNVGKALNPYNWAKGLSRNWLGAGIILGAPPQLSPFYYGPHVIKHPAMAAVMYGPGVLGKLGAPKPPPGAQQARR